VILLPQPPGHIDYRCKPPRPAQQLLMHFITASSYTYVTYSGIIHSLAFSFPPPFSVVFEHVPQGWLAREVPGPSEEVRGQGDSFPNMRKLSRGWLPQQKDRLASWSLWLLKSKLNLFINCFSRK
jgi:hypothetical protein